MIKASTKVRQTPETDTFGYVEYRINGKPRFQVLWICSWRVRLESNQDPKFVATVTGATSMLSTVRFISLLKIFHCNKDSSFLCLSFFNQIRARATLDNTELSIMLTTLF